MALLERDTIARVLDTVKDKDVVVIGDFMLDRYLWGNVSRISPEAPVPVVEVNEDAQRPGGAGNVVLNLTSLGVRCRAVGLVGDDLNGEALRTLLSESGADTDGLIASPDRPTTVKTRVIADEQQLVRVDRERTGIPPDDVLTKLVETVRDMIDHADAVILQDYNKGVLTKSVIRAAIDISRERDIPITVDPKLDNFYEYWGATVFKPNLREAEGAMGRRLLRDVDLERTGSELLVRLQSKMVLITRGGQGMSLFEENQSPKHIPTRARTISDVSGAGDTVISTMTLGMIGGLSGYNSALLATKAAGYVVGQVGVVPITPEALLDESGD